MRALSNVELLGCRLAKPSARSYTAASPRAARYDAAIDAAVARGLVEVVEVPNPDPTSIWATIEEYRLTALGQLAVRVSVNRRRVRRVIR